MTIAVWLLLGAAGFVARGQLDDVTSAGQSSYLPDGAQSTEVANDLQANFKGGDDVPVILVFSSDHKLTPKDLDGIGAAGRDLNKIGLTGATEVFDPFSGAVAHDFGEIAKVAKGIGPISRNGKAALVVLAIDSSERGAIVDGVRKIRTFLADHPIPGVSVYVTGPGGIAADLETVADDAGRTLLFATLALVLILLLIVYRAPVLAVLPLVVVGVAYAISTGITYLLIKAGWIVVNVEGTLLLLVLIFGAGTDYSLLLVHRYREELGRGLEPLEALREGVAESAPAIAASAGTVIAAMMVLLLADLESTHWLGPVLAIGIAVMLVAAFTLLPALLAALGMRRAFWPKRPAGDGAADERWERIAGFVRRRARLITVCVSALLLVLSLGNLTDHDTLGFGQGVTKPTNSSRGTTVLEDNFPPGLSSPLTVLVDPGQTAAALEGLGKLHTVKVAIPVPPPSKSP